MGIWLQSQIHNNRYGILHFAHQFMQIQPNFAQSPLTQLIWQTFPMTIENDGEVMLTLKLKLNSTTDLQPVIYTSDESTLLSANLMTEGYVLDGVESNQPTGFR